MSDAPAARTYARALIEAAGADADRVADELDQVADISRSAPAEWTALVAPGIPSAVRKATIDQLLADGSQITRNVLKLLVDNGRLAEAPELAAAYRSLVRGRHDQLDVHVTTAVDMPDELRTRLEQRLSSTTGKQVQLHASVDPSIIGGLVVRHGDTLVDTSLKGRLESLRLALSRPAPKSASSDG